MRKEEWVKKGYADEAIPEGVDLKAEIRRLCKCKDRCGYYRDVRGSFHGRNR